MKVYKDIISGDELFSDSYKAEYKEDLYYEIKGEFISSSTDIDDSLIGGNKSAEVDYDEGVDSNTVSGINIVLAQNLVETNFDKDGFKTWLKGYCKSVKEQLTKSNPDRVDAFQKAMQTFAIKVIKNLKEYQFYTGESMNPEGMVILSYYSEDDQTNPKFIFFKDGLNETKY